MARARSNLPPGLLLRLIDRDQTWVAARGRQVLGGAVLSTRSLVSADGPHLLDVVSSLGIPHLMDPDTAVLVEVEPGHRRAEWLTRMPAGAEVSNPPVRPRDLDDPADLERFSRAVVSTQRNAAALSAGYFRIESEHDAWRNVNRRLLESAYTAAAGRPVAAWLELTAGALLQGVGRLVANDYARADFVVLRIAGLRAASAREADVHALFQTVDTLRGTATRVIIDGLGSLSTAALAIGAYAVSVGADHHRSIPLVRVHRRPPSARALGYEVPLEFRQLPLLAAREELQRGKITTCVADSCLALSDSLQDQDRARVLREHFVHSVEADAQFAHGMGPAAMSHEMLASPEAAAQRWGRVLARWADAASTNTHSPR